MATRIEFDGIDEIMKDLNQMNKLLESGSIDSILHDAIQPAYRRAKSTAARDKKGHRGRYGKGHMADNIPLKLVRDGKTRSIEYGWEKSDRSDYYYAKFVEWGTSNKNYPKQPFMYKSLKKEKTVCLTILSDRIKELLKL